MGKQTLKGTAAGIAAGITFLLFLIELGFGVIISAGAAIAVYAGITLLIGSARKSSDPLASPEDEASRDFFLRTIAEGKTKLERIKQLESRIANEGVKQKVAAICQVGENIIDQLRKDPKDVKLVRSFFSYYLDATYNILLKYSGIAEKSMNRADIIAALDKAEQVLAVIHDQFEEKLAKLLQEDVFDLDTEIEALEQIMKSEGIKR